jgi:hypothetical protein
MSLPNKSCLIIRTVLRRGKDLLENALVEDVPAEMSGEELKIQV